MRAMMMVDDVTVSRKNGGKCSDAFHRKSGESRLAKNAGKLGLSENNLNANRKMWEKNCHIHIRLLLCAHVSWNSIQRALVLARLPV